MSVSKFISNQALGYLVIGGGLLLTWWFLPIVLFFICPGFLLLFHPIVKKMSLVEMVALILILSLATLIVVFSLTKFIPLNFSWLSPGISLISIGVFIYLLYQHKLQVIITKQEIISLLFFLPLFGLFLPLYLNQLVPAGTDMATHTYIARVIIYFNAFPKTFEPIVPITHFGFEPYGLPVIMASLTHFGFAMNQASLFVAVFIYPFAGLVVFGFLRKHFSTTVSLLTTYALLFIDRDFASYLSWGGHPTIWSLIFILADLSLILCLVKVKSVHWYETLVVAVLSCAAFLIHPTPVIAAVYFFSGPALYYFFRQKKKSVLILFLIKTIAISFIFLIPFVTSIQSISQETYDYLRHWQQIEGFETYSPNSRSLLTAVPDFIFHKNGADWFYLIIIGLFAHLLVLRKHLPYLVSALVLYVLTMINSQYWFLPLSAALYPDRLNVTAEIIFSYLVAAALSSGEIIVRKLEAHILPHRKVAIWLILAVITSYLTYQSGRIFLSNYSSLMNTTAFSLVTEDDLIAFKWIENHTNPSDIFKNNYGDASMWIPGLVGRRVLRNDAVPHSFDELGRNNQAIANYAFIGSKMMPDSEMYFTELDLPQQGYRLVFSSGQSQVYQKIATP